VQAAETIERREYKYLADETTAHRVCEAVRPFCELDSHAARQPTKRYWVSSLYFDTHDLALYDANQHERVDRFKIRARSYPGAGSAVFLEVKRRVNDVIKKTRGVAGPEWPSLLEEPKLVESVHGANRAAVERFVCFVHTFGLRPTLLVRYQREAWVSQIDDYARVTIDRHVESQPQERLSFEGGPREWRSSDDAVSQRSLLETESMCIIELKFTSAVPRWMMDIVQRFDLFRSAYSKYGTSIQAWHLPPQARRIHRSGAAA
jgi:hypothetical protein